MGNYTIGCTWFLANEHGKLLMMLRDDKPGILYPNHWVFPGGTVEGNETPEQASLRELNEELGFEPVSMKKVMVLFYPNGQAEEHFYFVPFEVPFEKVVLGEGQRVQFFSLEEIENLQLGFWCREVIPILRKFLRLRLAVRP